LQGEAVTVSLSRVGCDKITLLMSVLLSNDWMRAPFPVAGLVNLLRSLIGAQILVCKISKTNKPSLNRNRSRNRKRNRRTLIKDESESAYVVAGRSQPAASASMATDVIAFGLDDRKSITPVLISQRTIHWYRNFRRGEPRLTRGPDFQGVGKHRA